ncbi:AraC family transcriptional regulator [Leuconostoc miyukkimchii]|uniref:AraC family transcriptional regulator n=1 Tax=Leuconostoc miyukkimchii TaxID=910540 RepID=UPI001C7D7FC7|nr:AraC family transcriptional regulator [Leuconostoc miyukkimchii]
MDNLILLAKLFDGSVLLLDPPHNQTYYSDSINSQQKVDIDKLTRKINLVKVKNIYEIFIFTSGFVLRIKISKNTTIFFVVFQQENLNFFSLETNLIRIMSDKKILCQALYAAYTKKQTPRKQILFRKLDTDFSTNYDLLLNDHRLGDISIISTNLMMAINDSDEKSFKIFLNQFINLPINGKRLSYGDLTRGEKNVLISYVSIIHRNIITHGYPTNLSLKLQSVIVNKIELSSHFTNLKKILIDLGWLYFREMKKFNQKHGLPTADIIKNYIDAHTNQKLTLNDIAFTLTIPINNLNPIFKEKYHESIKSYIIHRKIEEAAQLLINTDLSISDIAENLAFASVSHFTSSFKHAKNITPKKYRNRLGIS